MMLHHKKAVQFLVLLITCQLQGAETKAVQTSIAQALSREPAVAHVRARQVSTLGENIQAVECIGAEKAQAWAELAEILQPFLNIPRG